MSTHTSSPFVKKALLWQSIGSVRLIIALFTIGAAIIKLLYNHFLPELVDIDFLRWSIIALGSIFFLTTFIPYRRSVIVPYFSFFLYLLTLIYVIAFAVINHFDPNAVTILILVVGASTIIINSLLYYGIQSLFIIVTCAIAFVSFPIDNNHLIALLNLLLALGAFGIVIAVRLSLISSLQNSHANLEKLNVLALIANKEGEIIFVSPSVKQLLGYEPAELLKEGWWRTKNLEDGWIEREFILNYPNILPKEIITIETSVRTKDGQKVWLTWANSIMPNGNYMGVALDVTKYKLNSLRTSPLTIA
ncbi:MAG: PAS domain S-box protein [Cyclobacteriaceae bacterium]|nr:PAS domain S-box protein [Cyclobacteriaceae bacterium]